MQTVNHKLIVYDHLAFSRILSIYDNMILIWFHFGYLTINIDRECSSRFHNHSNLPLQRFTSLKRVPVV